MSLAWSVAARRVAADTETVTPAGTPESSKSPAATPARKVRPVRSTVTVAAFRFPSPSVAGPVPVIDAPSVMGNHLACIIRLA